MINLNSVKVFLLKFFKQKNFTTITPAKIHLSNKTHLEILFEGAVIWNEWRKNNPDLIPDLGEANLVGFNLVGFDLSKVNLEGADLERADLEGTILENANLKNSSLFKANLKNSNLMRANLNGSNLRFVNFENAALHEAHFENTDLYKANLNDVGAEEAVFVKAKLNEAYLRRAYLVNANFEGAYLTVADLEGANLKWANLESARLTEANLEKTDLTEASLGGAELNKARLSGANLSKTRLVNEKRIGPYVLNTNWGDAVLSDLNWLEIKIIGEEYLGTPYWTPSKARKAFRKLLDRETKEATQAKKPTRNEKAKRAKEVKKAVKARWIKSIKGLQKQYRYAAIANRQLSVKLGEQGLTEEASYFAYKYNDCYRKYLKFSIPLNSGKAKLRIYWQYLFSLLLWAVVGYGYKVPRALLVYLGSIFIFGVLYWLFLKDACPGDNNFIHAFVESINIFHGRGIASPDADLITNNSNNLILLIAGGEAIFGLLIEVTFIAALTKRLFGG